MQSQRKADCRLLNLLHQEMRCETRAAQLSYLADVFSHGVVIQPSFGLELFFAVLTLQGILQLKELRGRSPGRPRFTIHFSSGCCCCSSISPMGSCCCSSTQWWDPAGNTASLSPIPTAACSSEFSLCCPGYCYQTHMAQLLANIPFWM